MSECLFSIVMPVHNVRAYLRECVDSVLGQSFADFELVAVDDASPDGSGQILDDYAAADARVKVRHLEQNVGLGEARNIGLSDCVGTYVLFLDSDDKLTPGSLAALAKRIEKTDRPDIVIFDYARTYWSGRVTRNILADSLSGPGSANAFAAEDAPELLELLMVVWNKAYRRDFATTHGFRFPTGYYEDLAWTYPTMLTAERIAVLDRVCYHYRQRRHGNILRSRNLKHFDAFDQYERVFAYVDQHPDLERWRNFLFRRMVSHLIMIMTTPGRVSGELRHQYFDRIVLAYQRLRPEGYEPPSGVAGLKQRTVARGDYAAFQTVQFGGQVIRQVNRRVARTKKATQRRVTDGKRSLIHAYYWRELQKPIDENLAVYSAYWSTAYSCNPRAIYEEAKRLAPHIRGVWVVKHTDVHVMAKGVDFVLLNSPEYYSLMARAKYFVNNVNYADNIVKRPGAVHLQTQHGTPLKKMGIDLQQFPVGAARMNFFALLRRCDRWDYLVSSNRFSSEVWERSYPSAYVTLETGYPRNDRLVRATAADTARLRRKLRLSEDTTVVLYAPTFRDWARKTFQPPVDLADFCARLGEGYTVLVRGHYFTDNDPGLAALEQSGVLRDVSDYPNTEDLMIASDVLLTDYSSIMFDYANLDHPIVVYANDWDTYRRVRGVNFDLLAQPPGIVERTQAGLVDAFTSGRYRDASAEAARKEFAKRFCEFDDGHAAERVVRRVLLGEELSTVGHATRGTGVEQGGTEFGGDVLAGSDDGARAGDRQADDALRPDDGSADMGD